ncbi:exodeoxyribonuclease VII large subunit [Patescibacteria group bacterium]|jgi:exodeoxyribonuclease VII large subunit|nr:exodeoxyribonuclease VII large subunit [Patescibacteria group bacterium]
MHILSVSQYVAYLNDTFKAIWDTNEAAIEGEVSEFRISQGQWVNFNLKDQEAVVSCFAVLNKLRVPIEDGMRVRVSGSPRVYPKWGKLSFNVERVELVGEGALRKALAALRAKLEAEGLFDASRKRELPRFPSRIALVASRESAAFGDFIRVVNERWRGVEIDLYHAVVQGDKAPDSVMAGLASAQKHGPYDAIVITRGGGSFEELMAFNDERLVRAIYASKIPTMVAIGHERDVTLAEEVADVRGSTPTDCARRLVPDRKDVLYELAHLEQGIAASVENLIEGHKETLTRFESAADRWLEMFRLRLDGLHRLIASFSPEAVLKRGFAILTDKAGDVVASIKDAKPGMPIAIRLRDGSVDGRIEGSQGTLI